MFTLDTAYRKIPKISPSKNKPPKLVTQKNPPLNPPLKQYNPRGALLGNCPQKQSETKKNGRYPTKNKASLIDFKAQISFRT